MDFRVGHDGFWKGFVGIHKFRFSWGGGGVGRFREFRRAMEIEGFRDWGFQNFNALT